MQIAKILQDIANEQAELNKKIALLHTLPQDLDVEHLFPLHGRWYLTVRGDVKALLEALPPSNARMTLDGGTWVGIPEDRPLDWNQRVLAVTANVSGYSQGVNWFHKLSSGDILAVKAAGEQLPIPPGYSHDGSAHSTIAVRKVQPLRETVVSPEEAWQQTWDAFFAEEGYRITQLTFARTLKLLPSRDEVVTFDMLPLPAESTMQLGDNTLTILHGGGDSAPETLPAGSPLHSFLRIGRFWNCFTKAQAERLIAFANAQRCNLEKRQRDAVKEGIAKAREAIAAFQTTYLDGGVANAPLDTVLTHWVQEKTGFPVHVTLHSQIGSRTPGDYSLGLHLWKWNEGASIQTPAVYNPDGFDFHNPGFYSYKPNSQRFFEEQVVEA